MRSNGRNIIRRRRGFAGILAIALIILVSGALVVLGQSFAAEVIRTEGHKRDAQLRQLLIAASAVAVHRADHPGEGEQVTLPAALSGEDAEMFVRPSGTGERREAAVRVRLAGRELAQELTLVRADGRWNVR
jgi:hypothetical protein